MTGTPAANLQTCLLTLLVLQSRQRIQGQGIPGNFRFSILCIP